MKKMYFLLVFFGALLFCACEKENIDPLIEDQAQVENQFEDGVLKAADLPELIEEPGTPLPFWARAGTGFPNLIPATEEYGILYFYVKRPASTIPSDFNLAKLFDRSGATFDPSVQWAVKGTSYWIPDRPGPPYMSIHEDKSPVQFWIMTYDQVLQVSADGVITIPELEGLTPAPMKGFSKSFVEVVKAAGGGAPDVGINTTAYGHLEHGRKFFFKLHTEFEPGGGFIVDVTFEIIDK